MIDLSVKVSGQAPESEEMSLERISSDGINLKTCADCGTHKTPLWRGGPAGPKSLCNACGIRSRKKRRAQICIKKEDKKPKKSTINKQNIYKINITSTNNNNNNSSSNGEKSRKNYENSLKKKLLFFSGKVSYQRPRSNSSNSINQKRKLGEIEQAAFLLMALSCG